MPFFQEFSYCIVPQPNILGDGRCHNVGTYNTAGCSFDGGDCKEFNIMYPDCEAEYPFLLGDGICHIENNNTECKFDGGDCLEFAQRFPECPVDNTSLLGNGVCDGGFYNTAECGFDDRDCLNFNEEFPGCNVDIPTKIGNGICNKGPYNTPECNFDNGDCDDFNQKHPICINNNDAGYKGLKCTVDLEGFKYLYEWLYASVETFCVLGVNCTEWLSERYPKCKAQSPQMIGDGICIGDTFSGNNLECEYEGGDCADFNKYFPYCNIAGVYRIGDGICDGGSYNTPECGFDGGDCDEINMNYPNCTVDSPGMIDDGYCDRGLYNTPECGFDGGDCVEFNKRYPNCIVDSPGMIGDGQCDGGSYNTFECGFDGGDCDTFNKYPNCTVNHPHWLGDGNCNSGPYNTIECGFDDGDCDASNMNYPKCDVTVIFYFGDGECHGGSYNTPECGFDDGDCIEFNTMYPNCNVEHPKHIGDGFCSSASYNTPECGFDGGDCDLFNTMYPKCTVDNPSYIGDGSCNEDSYNNPECGFDGGDCLICSSDNQNCLNNDGVLFIDGEKIDTNTSKRESLINAILQTVTSTISLIASTTILWMIYRSHEKLATTFHCLLMMLCISDIVSSTALSLSTIPIPSDYRDIIWNAQGNTATCQMQGFFIFLGSMAAPLYNCSLCWYYVFVVKFQKKDNYIKKNVEPFLHGIPIIFSLTGAITILANGAFNANMSFCFIGSDPSCNGFDCISTFDANVLFIIFSAVPYIILPIVIIVTMAIMFQAVLSQENSLKKYGSTMLRGNIQKRDELEGEINEIKKGYLSSLLSRLGSYRKHVGSFRDGELISRDGKMSRLILNRAFAYSLGFILTYTLPMIISIRTLLNLETGFALSVFGRILFPLQGFFNFLIFIYPKVLQAKRSDRNLSWCRAFVRALLSKGKQNKFQANIGADYRCCVFDYWKKRGKRATTFEEEKVEIESATPSPSSVSVKSNLQTTTV